MRREGAKLSRGELYAEPAHHGYLSMRTHFADAFRPPDAPGSTTYAFLAEKPDREWRCLLHLRNARVNCVKGVDFVIVGQEGSKGRYYSGRPYRQAWLCRLIGGQQAMPQGTWPALARPRVPQPA